MGACQAARRRLPDTVLRRCALRQVGDRQDVSDQTSDNRWEQRLSPLIIKGGVLPAPSVLLRHAGELNLTPQELVL